MRKAISSVIAIILLVLITVVASVAAFFWFTMIQGRLEDAGSGAGSLGCSKVNLITMRGDRVVVQNTGCDNIRNVTLLIDGVLTEYDLNAPLAPGDSAIISFVSLSSGEDHCVKLILSSGLATEYCSSASENTIDSGYGLILCFGDGDCDDSNPCTNNTCLSGACTYPVLSNGQYNGCTSTTGCTGTSPVLCACFSGNCTDTCGDSTCQSWENIASCAVDCVTYTSCSESSCPSNRYTFFSGGILGSNSTVCACCADNRRNETFYNNSLMCSDSGVIYDADAIAKQDWFADLKNYTSGKYVCELKGYTWLSHNDSALNNRTITTSFNASKVALSDVDSDNDLDIIVSSGNKLYVLINNGTGGFSEYYIGSLSTSIGFFEAADIDGDLDNDIVSVWGGAVTAWVNNGTGGFTNRTIDASAMADIIMFDFENDSDIDFVTYSGAYTYKYTNNGSGYFTKATIENVYQNIRGLAPGNLDLDNDVDYFMGCADFGDFFKVINNGLGGFARTYLTDWVSVYSVASGDFNGDGNLDAIASSESGHFFLRNNGQAIPSFSINNIGGAYPTTRILPVDIDNDGDLDFISLSWVTGNINKFVNNGSGSFTNSQIYYIDPNTCTAFSNQLGFSSGAFGDVDGDGDGDLIIVSGCVTSTTEGLLLEFENSGLSGISGPCCGDDGVFDNFSNGTHSCCSGVYQTGSC